MSILALPAASTRFAQYPSILQQRSGDWLPAFIDIEDTGPVSDCHEVLISGTVTASFADRGSGS